MFLEVFGIVVLGPNLSYQKQLAIALCRQD